MKHERAVYGPDPGGFGGGRIEILPHEDGWRMHRHEMNPAACFRGKPFDEKPYPRGLGKHKTMVLMKLRHLPCIYLLFKYITPFWRKSWLPYKRREQIVRIGKTDNPGSRIESHRRNHKFDHVEYIPAPTYHHLSLESALLRFCKPSLNGELGVTDPQFDPYWLHRYNLAFTAPWLWTPEERKRWSDYEDRAETANGNFLLTYRGDDDNASEPCRDYNRWDGLVEPGSERVWFMFYK